MLQLLTDPSAWAALVTLTALEIVLGIDNIVFISVLVSRCSPREGKRARQIGLSLALVFRILLLFGLTYLMKLTYPVATAFGRDFSWHDVILIAGGQGKGQDFGPLAEAARSRLRRATETRRCKTSVRTRVGPCRPAQIKCYEFAI